MAISARPTLPKIDANKVSDALKLFVHDSSESNLAQLVDLLDTEIVGCVSSNVDKAAELATVLRLLAVDLQNEYGCAVADRAAGHVAYARADYAGALGFYQSAVTRFEMLGRDGDIAHTVSGALQTLICLDQFEQAKSWAQRARSIFAKTGDHLRMARLDSNFGDLLYRRDRYAEARLLYIRAHEQFVVLGQTRDIAAALSKLAASAISLGAFDTAIDEYRAARAWCASNNILRLVAEADYNIAYLHFLKGDYLYAIDLYRKARASSKQAGDAYHVSRCDLDQAEVYLDLNFLNEGLQLAERAARGFSRLGMNYEHAKALMFVAIVYGRRGQDTQALRLFSRARRAVTGAHNPVWPAVIDLYRAACLRDLGLKKAAGRINRQAHRVFAAAHLHGKAAQSDLLLGRLYFEDAKLKDGLAIVNRLLRSVDSENQPVATFQAMVLKGEIEIAMANSQQAERTLTTAIEQLEASLTRAVGDELDVAFIQDKAHVYALLIDLVQSGPAADSRAEQTFDLMERSKSRTLAEWVTKIHGNMSPPSGSPTSELIAVRQNLNAQYHRLEEMLVSPQLQSAQTIQALRKSARDSEVRLSRLLSEQQQAVWRPDGVYWEDGPIRLWLIQNSIPPGCAIIEYYVTSNAIFVALIAKESMRVVRLASLSAVKPPLDLLKFHFGRRRNHGGLNMQDSAQRHHLAELYDQLVRPIRPLITATHLIIIPHGPLHQVPYHALLNGDRFLIDDFTVTYAPSATLFYQSLRRPLNRQTLSLVMGVPDRKAPYIEEEIQTVADLLPRAIHCLGDGATEAVLRRHASESRYIHIASKSVFRPDNPMFSSIQLSDFRLNVFDLRQMEIRADLVALSGCGTVVNGAAQGDELVGMARGFLRAGARSVMMTLWDVDDRSTPEFMKLFYSSLATGAPIQQALRSAMLKLREQYPAPFFWAPFVVSGGIDIEQSR